MADENGVVPQEESTEQEQYEQAPQEAMEEQTVTEEGEGEQAAECQAEPVTTEEEAAAPATVTEPGSSNEDDDDKKLFVGNLNWETTEEELKTYFSKFGEVVEGTLKKDHEGNSRGFGFITFADVESRQKVLDQEKHELGGRNIDPKVANPRQQKIFVGGLDTSLEEDEVRKFFSQYGEIEKLDLPAAGGQRRAFAFITYKTEAAVIKAIEDPKKKLGNRECEVKKAGPNLKNQPMGGRGRGRGGAWGGYGQGYGGYGYGGYGGYGGGYGGYGGYGYGAYDGYSGWGDYSQGYGGYGGYTGGGYDYWGQGYDQSNSGHGKAQRGGRGSYHPYQR